MKRLPWPLVLIALLVLIIAGIIVLSPHAPPKRRPAPVLVPAAPPAVMSDAEYCAQQRRDIDRERADPARRSDPGRRIVEVEVNCETRTILVGGRVPYDRDQLRRGWQEGIRRDLNRRGCADAETRRRVQGGWHLITRYRFRGGPPFDAELHCG